MEVERTLPAETVSKFDAQLITELGQKTFEPESFLPAIDKKLAAQFEDNQLLEIDKLVSLPRSEIFEPVNVPAPQVLNKSKVAEASADPNTQNPITTNDKIIVKEVRQSTQSEVRSSVTEIDVVNSAEPDMSEVINVEAWPEEITPEDMEVVLHTDVTELYESFERSIGLLIEQVQISEETQNKTEADEQISPIVGEVSARLAELDIEHQSAAASAMRDLIGALHGIKILESRGARQSEIADVEEKLTQLCISFFESLDIEYTEQDVNDFVEVLRSSVFQTELRVDRGVELKDLGTHEAKHFARATNAVNDHESYLHHVLGIFTLFCVGLPAQHR